MLQKIEKQNHTIITCDIRLNDLNTVFNLYKAK